MTFLIFVAALMNLDIKANIIRKNMKYDSEQYQ